MIRKPLLPDPFHKTFRFQPHSQIWNINFHLGCHCNLIKEENDSKISNVNSYGKHLASEFLNKKRQNLSNIDHAWLLDQVKSPPKRGMSIKLKSNINFANATTAGHSLFSPKCSLGNHIMLNSPPMHMGRSHQLYTLIILLTKDVYFYYHSAHILPRTPTRNYLPLLKE